MIDLRLCGEFRVIEGISMKRYLLCGLVALLAASCAARADSFYLSEPAWAAALSGSPTTINFEGIANPLIEPGIGPGTSIAVGGVNFAIGPAGTSNVFFVIAAGYDYGYPVAVISAQPESLNYPGDFLITPSASVTALGFDFGSLGTGFPATITLSDGSVQTVTDVAGVPNLQFFGVTAPGGITSVDITIPGTTGLDVADFSFGTEATPEPSSILLLGSGLVGFAGMLRRKLKA
jgi:hypothetical protein